MYSDNIRKARESKGLSVVDMAKVIRKDPEYVMGVEFGNINPKVGDIKLMAMVLNISCHSLLYS